MEHFNRTNKRRVMIGTPCMYGDVNVWYTNSLINTIKIGLTRDIEILPLWISYDALIQRVRNDTLAMALQTDVDDLFWIDSDIEWEPSDFFKLLDYPVDVVGGTYRKKGDIEEYVFRGPDNNLINPHNGLAEVLGLGTGFARMSKKACRYLYDNSPKYIDSKDNTERSFAFNVVIEDAYDANIKKNIPTLVSEDIHAFNVLREGGFKIYLDCDVTCNHIGSYKFTGDFKSFLEYSNGKKQPPGKPAIQRTSFEQKSFRQLPKPNRQL